MTNNFIQKANKKSLKKGREGVFKKKAEKQGMSTKAYANKVIRDLKGNTKNETQKRLLKQAVYAKNLIGFKK